ncbi:MAG: bifunctional DNA-formamidopyrimidine glycosylase/DNA-(apurinic or apyrimidinic site) lyase [Gammaproteobacteria bacterium]|nr:bifunctional DNA-formamidopyrimidine glycosylase/DNA-(apurinic or apyrimidinic site) lyase [Gammaproteobacteria bacterium]
MPELPEVETTRRGIAPLLEGRRIRALVVRERRLRWPVPKGIENRFADAPVISVGRRAKYLLLQLDGGTALLHLGMSGSLRIAAEGEKPGPHDHFDILTDAGRTLRFEDPRKFGSLLWAGREPFTHPLLAALGPEPLGGQFDGHYLWQRARGRKVAIKNFIMNATIVVGVGNIYASESLHRARIDPRRAAGRLSRASMELVATAIREVLTDALTLGGTTLRDFHFGEGQFGYFGQALRVYDRAGLPCPSCSATVRHLNQGQRSTYWCPSCQR